MSLFVWAILSAVCGLVMGSVITMMTHRLNIVINDQEEKQKSRLNLFWPPSHCPECLQKLCWYDNIPVLSWILLCGKCRNCRNRIPASYILTEIFMLFWGGGCAWLAQPGIDWGFLMAFGAMLILLTAIDFRHRLLPDVLTLSLLWMGILWHITTEPSEIENGVLGAIAGYLSLWLLYHIFRFIYKREALGLGDVKFIAALGSCLGWQALPMLLLIASSLTTVGILILFKGRFGRYYEFPFGPGLAAAGVILLVWQRLN